MEDIVDIPKYHYNKGTALPKADESRVEAAFKQVFDRVIPLPETPLNFSPEQEQMITSLIQYQSAWIKENLHISIDSRIPSLDKIRIYSPEDFQVINARLGRHPGGVAITTTPVNEIIARSQEDKDVLCHIIGHELLHTYSDHGIQVKDIYKEDRTNFVIDLKSDGYVNVKKKVFEGIDEWIKEMMNIEILDGYRKKDGREMRGFVAGGYVPGVLFLAKIVDLAAQKMEIPVPARELRKLLYTGFLTGNFSALRFFNEAFGKDALRVLSTLGPLTSEDDLADIFVNSFNGDRNEYLEDVARLGRGERGSIINGISVTGI